MAKTFIFLFLFSLALGTFLRIDRWSVIEKSTKAALEDMLNQLRYVTSPSETYDKSFISKFQIWNFRGIEIIPRTEFISATFNSEEPFSWFCINMPLGFHFAGQLEWIYNFLIFPISGKATFDIDIFDMVMNISLNVENKNIKTDINVAYNTEKNTEIIVSSVFAKGTAQKTLDEQFFTYFKISMRFYESIFKRVLTFIYETMHKKSIRLITNYRSIHHQLVVDCDLLNVTTRDGLVAVYGKNQLLPNVIPASSRVRRQYCVDSEYLNAIIANPWSLNNLSFTNDYLPVDHSFPVTVSGFAQVIPDIVNDYKRSDEAYVNIKPTEGEHNIKIERYNDTHGSVTNAKFTISLFVSNKAVNVLNADVECNIIVVPVASKTEGRFNFNVQVVSVSITKVNVTTPYSMYVKSNLEKMLAEYINDLFIAFFGRMLFGDGLKIEDEISAYSNAEFTVASNLLCLNLAIIS